MTRGFQCFFVVMSVVCVSCELELDVIIDEEPVLVIDARIINGEVALVKLSQTVAKTASDSFPTVTNAQVLLHDDEGHSEPLTQMEAGTYLGTSITGETGMTYTLSVSVADSTFEATSSMPAQVVPLDSVTHVYAIASSGDTTGSMVRLFFTDPAEQEDFGVIRLESDTQALQGYHFYEDGAQNGQSQALEIELKTPLTVGSNLSVVFFQVEQPIYDYFRDLDAVINNVALAGLTVAPPRNPEGNFNGKTLGYFGAMAVDRKTIVVD